MPASDVDARDVQEIVAHLHIFAGRDRGEAVRREDRRDGVRAALLVFEPSRVQRGAYHSFRVVLPFVEFAEHAF